MVTREAIDNVVKAAAVIAIVPPADANTGKEIDVNAATFDVSVIVLLIVVNAGNDNVVREFIFVGSS